MWKSAIQASDAAGHPYYDRPGKFEAALREYCKIKRLALQP